MDRQSDADKKREKVENHDLKLKLGREARRQDISVEKLMKREKKEQKKRDAKERRNKNQLEIYRANMNDKEKEEKELQRQRDRKQGNRH